MEFENLLILIKTVSDSELTDFAYEENGTSIHLKKKKETVVVAGNQPDVPIAGLAAAQAAASPATVNAETVQAASSEPEGMIVKSPLVGTFYAAPSEDADPFVSVGDQVKKGQTLAIVEAMKLMNEIESDFDGKVAEIYVQNGQAVEYGPVSYTHLTLPTKRIVEISVGAGSLKKKKEDKSGVDDETGPERRKMES